MFEELQFVSYRHHKALVYTISLEIQNVIIDNFELSFVLKLTSSKSDNEDNVFSSSKAIKKYNEESATSDIMATHKRFKGR